MSDSADDLMNLDDDYESTDDDFADLTRLREMQNGSCVINSFVDFSLPLDQVLVSMNRSVGERLDVIEARVDALNDLSFVLEQKVDKLTEALKGEVQKEDVPSVTRSLPEPQTCDSGTPNGGTHVIDTSGSKLTLITLNSEEDFPDGTWLGDDANLEMRVRCQISPTDLLHVNATCPTPEKMALTLMDCLFDRETQASSNISGTGKHKKKQLDPMKIYGIRCHLFHKFGIKEKDWQRIKQNMDSKCRTAFRRKLKGMPLHQFREKMSCATQFSVLKSPQSPLSATEKSDDQQSGNTSHVLTLQPAAITLASQSDFATMVNGTRVIQTAEGEIQIVQATAEQLAEIERSHQIHILSGSQVLLPDKLLHQVAGFKGDEVACEQGGS